MKVPAANLSRRRFLQAAAISGLSACNSLPTVDAPDEYVVNDVSQLNPVIVAEQRRARATGEIQAALRDWPGPVSVGGGRYSQGGQIAAPMSLHFDMRGMNGILSLDVPGRVIRVQAGTTWRDIQEAIDPHGLAVKIMQSFCNFTVGGSVSVNCHGRYVGRGPLVNSVRAVQMVTAEGEVLELTPTRNAELFRAVFGGYGGLGVLTEVELDLEENQRMERLVQRVALDRYPEFFRTSVLADADMVMHNADLIPPDFDAPIAVSWKKTDRPLTESARLVPREAHYGLEQDLIWAMTELPGGNSLREHVVNPILLDKPAVVWRNYEASLDVASLEPRTRRMSTYILQEYFIPAGEFLSFARDMARILKVHGVNALNVSIRHSPADTKSLMSWAPQEVFSFVLYYKQRSSAQASAAVQVWTRELIDAALQCGGRYYLPYRLHATRAQFERAYPQARAFAELKARVDPRGRFRNLLWNDYL